MLAGAGAACIGMAFPHKEPVPSARGSGGSDGAVVCGFSRFKQGDTQGKERGQLIVPGDSSSGIGLVFQVNTSLAAQESSHRFAGVSSKVGSTVFVRKNRNQRALVCVLQ